jgi:two-component system LytT family sensor kinase
MTSDSMSTSRVVAVALVVGVFFVAQEVLGQLASRQPVNVVNGVTVVLIFWVVWAFLTPLVLTAVRRWPLDAKPVYRPLLMHTSVAVILSVIQSTLSIPLRAFAFNLRGDVSFTEALRQRAGLTPLVWGVFTGVFFYSVVVMVYTALRFRSLYVAEQVGAAELESQLTQSKLDALRSQLRPHFLFNTLNAISILVTEDAAKAQQMILRLATLLRRSLDEDAHEVTLHTELAFVNDYLDIQRWRFGDRLTVHLTIDPAVVNACVPVFLLQPLLENAIEHGRSDDRRTTVALTASREHDMLRITLADDGAGVIGGVPVREGIGLGNARERLHHLYGSRATVELSAADGASAMPGAHVEIRIPFRESRP